MAVKTEIVPSTQTFRGLMNEGHLEVPRFQRAYSWKNAQVEQLFDDLNIARLDKAPHYFVGAMVLQADGGRITIVDGQQRLATLSIVLSVLRDHPSTRPQLSEWIQVQMLGRKDRHGNWTPALILSEADRERFRRSISLPKNDSDRQDPNTVKRTDCESHSEYRIVSAYKTIKKKLDELLQGIHESKQEELIDSLATTAADKIAFITISVPTDEMAYTVFETLNERGLGLSVADLLKNYLLSNAGTYQKDVDRTWLQLENIIDPDEIPRFLRHRHMATIGTISSRQLYKATKDQLDARSISIRNFVNEVYEDGVRYAALRDPDAGNWGNSDLRRSLSDLKRLRATQCLPLLLSCARRMDERSLLEVATNLEAFTIRYSVVGNRNPNELEPFYSALAIDVKDGRLSDASEIRKNLAAKAPDDEDFKQAFTKLEPVNVAHPSTRYLLERLEVRLWQDTGSPPDMYYSGKCHIEHLLPQTLTKEWEKTLQEAKAEHSDVVNLLGNLVLLEWKINIKNGNSGFREAKKKNLADSVYKSAKEIAKAHERWDVAEIRRRQETMANEALKVWSLR